MILAIPVSDADVDQAENLFQRIARLSSHCPIETPIVVSLSWKAWWDVEKLKEFLPQAIYYKIPTEEEIGWPESSNHMFYNTALYVADKFPSHAWYFMEADTYPLIETWWQSLQEEYVQVGKPYMGVISNSIRMIGTELKVTGKHMTGTAIYPADFLQRCKSIHYLMRDPWDIEIGPEILPEVHNTSLIAHRWSSYGYRYKDGVINIAGSRSPSPNHVQPIQPEAVVVHGCKDGSIYALDLPVVVG